MELKAVFFNAMKPSVQVVSGQKECLAFLRYNVRGDKRQDVFFKRKRCMFKASHLSAHVAGTFQALGDGFALYCIHLPQSRAPMFCDPEPQRLQMLTHHEVFMAVQATMENGINAHRPCEPYHPLSMVRQGYYFAFLTYYQLCCRQRYWTFSFLIK